MYHANAFRLTKNEQLPVYLYHANIEPQPVTRAQFYQILGILAKRIMYTERKPVVSIEDGIESLPDPISSGLNHSVVLPEVGDFSVTLSETGKSLIGLEDFENYSHIVCRLVDVALTIYSNEYYKFHPKAPNVLKDEPYFDAELIEKTGILDSKSYYRGLVKLGDSTALVLNRETQLRSHKNLLVEMQGLAKLYEEMNETTVDFYDPPTEFMSFVNGLLRGKAADIARSNYPGPSVRRIEGITWQYRAGDKIPGLDGTPIEYLHKTYGITGLDERQPLVFYTVNFPKKTQYHVPQVLSVGHTFEDLAKRIPGWQRSQVWGSIHPDCKNQLHKTYDVLLEIDKTLRTNIPEVYPKFVEISTEAMDVSPFVSGPFELELVFGNKTVKVNAPYDVAFYRSYSEKKVSFARPIAKPKLLVCVEKTTPKIKKFLAELSAEYALRNESELSIDYGSIEPSKNDYDGYQMVLTIGPEDESQERLYTWYKETLQNKMGIAHQHVTVEKADENSIMQIVMQLCLKMGGSPWLLPSNSSVPYVVGLHTYLNPLNEQTNISAIVLSGDGVILGQLDSGSQNSSDDLVKSLIDFNAKHKRVLYIASFDRLGFTQQLREKLGSQSAIEYCIVQVIDNSTFRFFATYPPRKAPRFGKAALEVAKCSIEAYENAPQGTILRLNDNSYYLLTGKTIEKEALRRGCPTPIKLEFLKTQGNQWKADDVAKYILSLCMMSRASGHMTRLPMPLYYLQLRDYYANRFGTPTNERIKQLVYYI